MSLVLPTFSGFVQPAGGGGGAFANALSGSFDGTDDYLSIAANSSLNTAGDWSFSCWFYADNATGYKAIAAKRDDAVAQQWQFAISGGVLDLYLPWGYTVSGSTTINTGQWYHVAFTVEVGETDGVKIYLNGSQESNTGNAVSSSNNTSVDIRIGDNSKNRYFNGLIDEVAMFHTLLSASDITAIYNSGVPNDISSLSPDGWWRLGDGTGDTDSGGGTPASGDTIGTVEDQSDPGGNDATVGGAPTYSSTVPS